jgi:cell division protein ZapA
VSGNTPARNAPVTVRILDREYTVGVSDSERASLTSAARLLDLRMREIRGSNKLVAPDRLAVLTALNLAHELQQLRDGLGGNDDAVFKLLDAANGKLDALLGPTA